MFPFTLQQLKILIAISREKNFTKAANLVYLSQPSISKQIKILEKNLNLLLVYRKDNKIFFTENGKIFLDYSKKILKLCDECCQKLADLKNGEKNTLIIGTTETAEVYFLPQIISLLAKHYSHLQIKIEIHSSQIIAKNVADGKFNLGIVNGTIQKKLQKYLTVQIFADDYLNLIVSKCHPFAEKDIISKEDLYTINFISLTSESTVKKLVNYALFQNKIKINQLKIIMEFNSMEGIKSAVLLGLGAAFVFSSVIKTEIKLKTINILKIENIIIKEELFLISNSTVSQTKPIEFLHTQFLPFEKNKT